ncbi:MAG: DUF4038 domain-containing protein [Limisphaerales bacterium]
MQNCFFRLGSPSGLRLLRRQAGCGAVLCLSLLALPAGLRAATESPRMPVVPKWGRFEQSFKSDVLYSNALQDATLTVVFTSPLGETNLVYGFWDGEKTWRVRFSPSQPGRWTYKTTCSDTPNRGLHNRAGEFLCTAPAGKSPFHVHGPVQVARDHHHLEYADGTPFFWLADTTWNGMQAADPKTWELYALMRAARRFTVIQSAAYPGQDAQGQTAIAGFPDRIAINPEFFQQLDAKLDVLTEAGLLSAIAPVVELELQQRAASPSDDQTALLVRYTVARWGAEPVVWLLAFDGSDPALVNRWKRIGQAVFSEGRRTPVMVCPGAAMQALEAFRSQNWVDLLGAQPITDFTDTALETAFRGPFFREWSNTPSLPIIPFLPCENGLRPGSQQRYTSEEVRKAAYWSLLLSPPAGLSYAGQGVVEWSTSLPEQKSKVRGGNLPLWRRAMFMPAAKDMTQIASFMGGLDFWRLRPEPGFLAAQPGSSSPGKSIAAEATEAKDLALVYDPEDRSFALSLDALPATPVAAWFNPRSGGSTPIPLAANAKTCQLTTPQPGDWVLVLRGGKR